MISVIYICITIALFYGWRTLQIKTKQLWLNPLFLSLLSIIACLVSLNIPYTQYMEGGRWLSYLIEPAVVVLGYPLYKQLKNLKKQWRLVIVSSVIGSFVAMGSAVLLAKLLGADELLLRSIASMCITTAIAIEVSEQLGGSPALAALLVMVAGVGVFPLKNFFLEGFTQNFLAWTTLLLFLGVPVVAFITWLIRRIMGVKSGNRYLGFTFAGLWVIGLICGGILTYSIVRNFDATAREKHEYTIVQPSTGKLTVKVPDSKVKVYGRWFKMDGIVSMNDDSLFLNNVRLRIVKSPDSAYHIYSYKYSSRRDEGAAVKNIHEISYSINQSDSTILLDRGFALKKGTKFRNQGVQLTIQVPVGKRILIDRTVSRNLNWFHVGNGYDWEWDEEWNSNNEDWNSNVEYVMTLGGLERIKSKEDIEREKERKTESDTDNDAIEQYKKSKEELQKEYERKKREADELKKELEKPVDTTRYRYKKATAMNDVEIKAGNENKSDNQMPIEASRLLMMQMVY